MRNKAYKILKKDKTKEFDIQLEDWSCVYPIAYTYGSTLAIYKEAKEDIGTLIKRHDKARFEFNFESNTEALKAYEQLLKGSKQPIDFIDRLQNPKYKKAL